MTGPKTICSFEIVGNQTGCLWIFQKNTPNYSLSRYRIILSRELNYQFITALERNPCAISVLRQVTWFSRSFKLPHAIVLKGKRIKIIFHSLFNRLHEAKLTKKTRIVCLRQPVMLQVTSMSVQVHNYDYSWPHQEGRDPD